MASITARIDATTEVSPEYSRTVLPPPNAVKISLDDNCQFRCQFCSSRLQPEKCEMPWETFTELVDELASVGVKEVGLFYIGEPMLAKRLVDAVRYCKASGIEYVFVTTNGQLATADRVDELMAAGLDSLKFSFNYADGWQIKSVAGVSPRVFDKIIQNIEGARRIRDAGGYKCGIYASSILFDGEQGERMKAAVEKILPWVDEHYWLPCFSFGGQTKFGQVVAGNPGRLGNMRDPLPCWAVMKEGHVTASGDVSACCFDSHKRWVAGNLRDMTFMQCWNSQFMQSLRAAHFKKDVSGTPCEKCAVGN